MPAGVNPRAADHQESQNELYRAGAAMRAHRYIPTRWQIDPQFLRLRADAKLIIFGLWTHPDSPTHGLSIVDPVTIGRAHGISERRVRHIVVELEIAGFIERDPDSPVILLRGFWEAQLGARPNADHKRATAAAIAALPDTPLIRRFRTEYDVPAAGQEKPKPRGRTRVTPTPAARVSPTPAARVSPAVAAARSLSVPTPVRSGKGAA